MRGRTCPAGTCSCSRARPTTWAATSSTSCRSIGRARRWLRALGPEVHSLGELGSRLNRILCRDGLPNRFATLVYLELAPDSGRVRLLNAGHMPPLVVRGDAVEELPRGSLALSLIATAEFAEQAVELQPGDTLVVYSDGVTEAMNPGGDFYGDERLRASLGRVARLPVDRLGASVVAAVDAFVGEARPHDDLSLVVLRRGPRPVAGGESVPVVSVAGHAG
jgi:sigma-B regulation protein RsbU (phosphoserine phosphatase)